MKRVVIFIYSLGGGGAEKVALELARGLKASFNVSIVTVSPVKNYNAGDIEVVSLYEDDVKSSPVKKLLSLFIVAFKLGLYCKKHKVDALVSSLSRPNIIAGIAKAIYPFFRFIAVEHTTLSQYYKQGFSESVLKKLLTLSYRFCDSAVAVSSGIKTDLLQNFGLKNDKITVIYNPIDIKRIRLLGVDRKKRDSDSFIFVTAGRLVESKNYPFLFDAFALLPSFCKLWILGDGELQTELKFLAVEKGIHERVTFFGFCENPYGYFASADAFVMSSKLEGLPTVLIEALASSLPIVSTDCKSGPREILGGEGEPLKSGLEKTPYGILVSLDSYRFLSLAMRKLIEDDALRAEFRASALKRAEFFSKEKSIEAYINLINGVKN